MEDITNLVKRLDEQRKQIGQTYRQIADVFKNEKEEYLSNIMRNSINLNDSIYNIAKTYIDQHK